MIQMKKLQVIDALDYTADMPVYERWAVRGIVVRDGKIAAQKGRRGDYKLLGGGMETGEDYQTAIMRELQEEAGLVVLADSISPLGEIEEIRQDLYEKGKVYHCHTYFFHCEAEDICCATAMTASEIEKGYHLVWEKPEVIVKANQAYAAEPWIYRDTEFVKMMLEHKV